VTLQERIRGVVRIWVDCFRDHNLLTYASAIAFQALVALVPMVLLGFGILGALGARSVWEERMAPPVQSRLPEEVFAAIDYSVERILTSSSAGLIAFGLVATIWEVSGSVRAIMGALNAIHGEDETRPWWERFLVSFGTAVVVSASLLGAIGVVLSAHGTWTIGAWPLALVLLGFAVAVLVRVAPVREQPLRWASFGSVLVVGAWVVAGLVFRVYVKDVASFTTAWGSLVLVLVLTAFLYVNSIIFLVGVQLDELIEDGKLKPYVPL